MNAGQLRHRVTIQAPGTTQDAAGQPVAAWTDVCTVWADVRYLSGLETIRADATTGSRKASVRIRYRADVTAAMRVVHGATMMNVAAVLPDAKRRHVDLACEAVK